jgi:hypothetical protein
VFTATFRNGMRRNALGFKMQQVREGCRRLHNAELRDWHLSSNIARGEADGLCMWHVWGRSTYRVLIGNCERRRPLRKSRHEWGRGVILNLPIPVAALSKEWVCGSSLAGVAGSNPAGGMDVCLL